MFTPSDAISIAGLYLALVGLLSTFFFVQLSQWANGILALQGKWKQVKGRTPKDDFFDARLDCYYQAIQASAPWTFLGWLVVTLFLLLVTAFELRLQSNLQPADIGMVSLYVTVPTLTFVVIYLLVSVALLIIGYRTAGQLRTDTEKNL